MLGKIVYIYVLWKRNEIGDDSMTASGQLNEERINHMQYRSVGPLNLWLIQSTFNRITMHVMILISL